MNTGTLFDRRLARHYDELKWLYMELYRDEGAFRRFAGMLERCWRERRKPLRNQDARREADPNWYRRRDLLGMMLYVDAFAGTLKGVEEKLPYLKECGVNYLHLMPLHQSPKGRSDGGYAVSDFRAVQPGRGGRGALGKLADACRKRNMSLCLDFVMNHTSEDHGWARRARAGEPCFDGGAGVWVEDSGDSRALALCRRLEGRELVCILSYSAREIVTVSSALFACFTSFLMA